VYARREQRLRLRRIDTEAGLLDDDRNRARFAEPLYPREYSKETAVAFRLDQLLAHVEMDRQAVHLQTFDQFHQRLETVSPELGPADVGEDRYVRGERPELEVVYKLGVPQENTDRSGAYRNPRLLRNPCEVLVARKPPADPPVIAEMNRGIDIGRLRNITVVSMSAAFISGSERWTRRTWSSHVDPVSTG